MTAQLIDGRSYAHDLRESLAGDVAELAAVGARPGLATVLAGEDYPALAYERRVRRLAEDLGLRYVCEALPADVTEADAVAAIGKLGADPRVSGILVLRPLPPQLAELAKAALESLDRARQTDPGRSARAPNRSRCSRHRVRRWSSLGCGRVHR
jgi:methylenetetrahydrofolate dehydrogenase (NADP+)/methenyltetrahydrofolate cyclohydrolase